MYSSYASSAALLSVLHSALWVWQATSQSFPCTSLHSKQDSGRPVMNAASSTSSPHRIFNLRAAGTSSHGRWHTDTGRNTLTQGGTHRTPPRSSTASDSAIKRTVRIRSREPAMPWRCWCVFQSKISFKWMYFQIKNYAWHCFQKILFEVFR